MTLAHCVFAHHNVFLRFNEGMLYLNSLRL